MCKTNIAYNLILCFRSFYLKSWPQHYMISWLISRFWPKGWKMYPVRIQAFLHELISVVDSYLSTSKQIHVWDLQRWQFWDPPDLALPLLPFNTANLVGDMLVHSPYISIKKPKLPGTQWINNKHLLKKWMAFWFVFLAQRSFDSSPLPKTSPTLSTSVLSPGLFWEPAAIFF